METTKTLKEQIMEAAFEYAESVLPSDIDDTGWYGLSFTHSGLEIEFSAHYKVTPPRFTGTWEQPPDPTEYEVLEVELDGEIRPLEDWEENKKLKSKRHEVFQ